MVRGGTMRRRSSVEYWPVDRTRRRRAVLAQRRARRATDVSRRRHRAVSARSPPHRHRTPGPPRHRLDARSTAVHRPQSRPRVLQPRHRSTADPAPEATLPAARYRFPMIRKIPGWGISGFQSENGTTGWHLHTQSARILIFCQIYFEVIPMRYTA